MLGFELPRDENYAMLLGGLHFVYNGSQRKDLNGTDYECVNLIQSKATSPRALVTENLAIATFVPMKRPESFLDGPTVEELKQLYDPKAHGPDTPGWDLPPSVKDPCQGALDGGDVGRES